MRLGSWGLHRRTGFVLVRNPVPSRVQPTTVWKPDHAAIATGNIPQPKVSDFSWEKRSDRRQSVLADRQREVNLGRARGGSSGKEVRLGWTGTQQLLSVSGP